MKKFFKEYGAIILGVLIISLLIAMISPVGQKIKNSLTNTASNFDIALIDGFDATENEETEEIDPALYERQYTSNLLEGSTIAGYSAWSTKQTNIIGETSAIQYGRQLPSSWSGWKRTEPAGQTDVNYMEEEVKHLAVDFDEGVYQEWTDADAKTIYTWSFTKEFEMISVHADVDTFYFYTDRDGDHYRQFSAPPLEVYCDGELVASTGKHDRLKNWDADLNKLSCKKVELKMLADTGNNRNGTSASNIYLIKLTPSWNYVTGWSEGTDWRFDEEYERIYGGENPQIPVSRKVYSYPLTYQINYDLDEGEFIGEVVTSYTINDEVIIPTAYKKGYKFLGFYDDNDNRVTKIKKGSYDDINLTAKFEKKTWQS